MTVPASSAKFQAAAVLQAAAGRSSKWSKHVVATLSGALDVIVVEQETGELLSTSFNARFGLMSCLKPSKEHIDFQVNGASTGIRMRLDRNRNAIFVTKNSQRTNKKHCFHGDAVGSVHSELPGSPGSVQSDAGLTTPEESTASTSSSGYSLATYSMSAHSPSGSPRSYNNSRIIDSDWLDQNISEIAEYDRGPREAGSWCETEETSELSNYLSSDELKKLNLRKGKNDMRFVLRSNGAALTGHIYLWDINTPIIVSNIDGTITSDSWMGIAMTLWGRDWSRPGISKLFSRIACNGYNILYLSYRSLGLADLTRTYLSSVRQDQHQLPEGPVILSADRTLDLIPVGHTGRQPALFKKDFLLGLQHLYRLGEVPFYAGFGNIDSDRFSYTAANVEKVFMVDSGSRAIFELNGKDGHKKGFKSIDDLVKHNFPPVVPEQQGTRRSDFIGRVDAMELTLNRGARLNARLRASRTLPISLAPPRRLALPGQLTLSRPLVLTRQLALPRPLKAAWRAINQEERFKTVN